MNIQYSVVSPYDFNETVSKFKEALGEVKFGVLWELNFKDKLQEKGLTFETNFKIMEACNPVKAEQVLKHNIEAGYFLPCKVVVYEKGPDVRMGMLLPTELIKSMGDVSLLPIAQDVEDALKKAMEIVTG